MTSNIYKRTLDNTIVHTHTHTHRHTHTPTHTHRHTHTPTHTHRHTHTNTPTHTPTHTSSQRTLTGHRWRWLVVPGCTLATLSTGVPWLAPTLPGLRMTQRSDRASHVTRARHAYILLFVVAGVTNLAFVAAIRSTTLARSVQRVTLRVGDDAVRRTHALGALRVGTGRLVESRRAVVAELTLVVWFALAGTAERVALLRAVAAAQAWHAATTRRIILLKRTASQHCKNTIMSV